MMYDEDYFYELADKTFNYLATIISKKFTELKSRLAVFDELNVLNAYNEVNQTYGELKDITYERYLDLAMAQYERMRVNNDMSFEGKVEQWLYQIFTEVDDVTRYSYENELERKRQRTAEGVIAGGDINAFIDTSMRLYTRMVNQETLTIADKAARQAMIDDGMNRARWITQKDGKVCDICRKRNDKRYSIYDIPPKPHIGCRCIIVPD